MKILKYKNQKSIEILVAFLILMLLINLYNLVVENSFKSFFGILILGTLLVLVLTKHEWAKNAVRYFGIFSFLIASYRLLILFVAVYSEIPNDNALSNAIFSGVDFIVGIILFTENDKMFTMETIEKQSKDDSGN